ncbi:MAG: hypothetical protein U0625_04075 [Phycisphaerales bacterium]
MLRTLLVASAIALPAANAGADFIGWTARVRSTPIPHTYMVDVFAVTNDPADQLINRYGSNPGPSGGFITTNAAGGFIQGAAEQGRFAPAEGETTETLDSFLTVGGEIVAPGVWAPDVGTTGDPTWSVAYTNTNTGQPATANAFVSPSNSVGFTNPYLHAIPAAAGWYIAGYYAPAQPLAALGCRVASTSAAAAAATHGMLVAHLCVSDPSPGRVISWRLSASMLTPSGAIDQKTFEFTIPVNPDADGDGIIDCEDNCPGIANPDQADCNGNGIGDACDIASGTSTDLDHNGVPDECDDCNGNGLPDQAEIAAGTAPDCNSDGIPDDCQGAIVIDETTGNLGAPSGFEPRAWSFAPLPPAESGVELVVDVRGDLNGQTEYIELSLNGGAPQRFFQTDGQSCPAVPDRATLHFTREQFNALVGPSGALVVVMTCPVTVDPTECKGDGLTQFALRYTGIDEATGDCNGNLRLDLCETHDGTTPDCNGNGRPDSCDIADGIAVDCNADGLIDACQIAADPALDCNGNGRIDACDIAAGTSEDIDHDGTPDECQTVHVPGDYATIQAAIDAAPADRMRIVAVAPGSFAGPVQFLGKPVVVRGAGPGLTAIVGTGGQSVSVVRMAGEPAIAALERVSVRGGQTGTSLPGQPTAFVGGGLFMYQSGASVRDCVFEQNLAGFGGGAYVFAGTGSIAQCAFRLNHATSDAGGLQCVQGSMTIVDTLVEQNDAIGRGGGVHLVRGMHTMLRTTVRQNSTVGVGGGLSWVPASETTAMLTLRECHVDDNSALVVQGGLAILADGALPKTALQDSHLCGNTPRPNVSGPWTDLGGNEICDCLGDLTADGAVNGADLGILLGNWGPAGPNSVADLNHDGIVDGADLGTLLGAWGGCP